jgi:hypothetical protein
MQGFEPSQLIGEHEHTRILRPCGIYTCQSRRESISVRVPLIGTYSTSSPCIAES